VTPAEARDHRVVGNLRPDDEPIACITPAQPLNRPARADAVRISVDQQRQQHLRRKRRLTRAANPIGRFKPGQVHQTNGVDDQVDDVALRQPIHHVHR
jgi:hypothetical protein